MIDPFWGVIVAAIAPTVVASVAAYQAYRTGQTLERVHVQINSRMDQWIAASSAAAHANGKAEGISEERVRQPDRPKG